MMGVMLGPGRGVATMAFSSLFSSDLESDLEVSMKGSRLVFMGVDGLSVFSGDLGVEEPDSRPLSIMKLRSRTVPGCRDCIRLCAEFLANDRSGDTSAIRLASDGTKAVSRAFSVSAAWADWMAAEVPARDVDTLGD
jgi:hypothetical protein